VHCVVFKSATVGMTVYDVVSFDLHLICVLGNYYIFVNNYNDTVYKIIQTSITEYYDDINFN